MLSVGLLINPLAGLGGSVGLKGSDGDRAARAKLLGAQPLAARRAGAAIAEVLRVQPSPRWLSAAGPMGGELLASLGIEATPVYQPGEPSTGSDTRAAAKALAAAGVDLILFAGGDGTARDMLAIAGGKTPVLGIPAGVKMHSAVFALTPRSAGVAARRFLDSGAKAAQVAPREVMDREFLPNGEPASSPQLHGYLPTLQMPALIQAAKAATGGGGDGAVRGALGGLARELATFDRVLLGPGATLHALKKELGFDGTLLGVDVYGEGRCLRRDATEAEIWDEIHDGTVCLVLGVIGGQGFLLGRGNQQLSARILRRIGRDKLRVLASAEKLAALPQSTLYVDTGDEAVDRELCGFIPVITGPRRSTLCPIKSGTLAA